MDIKQMFLRKAAVLLPTAAMLLPTYSLAALDYTFSGTDLSGTGSGSATMSIVGNTTNTLTITLDNTSPTSLNAPATGDNTPGITGFGFNLSAPIPSLTSWTLTATDTLDNVVRIDDQTGGNGDWVMNLRTDPKNAIAGVDLDFLPTTDGDNIKGALYNPSATSGFGALPNYFTIATLTVVFDGAATVGIGECGAGSSAGGPCETFVRMQNVGLGGVGSLKLPGTSSSSSSDTPSGAPEPNVLALMGAGLLGGLLVRRRQRKQLS